MLSNPKYQIDFSPSRAAYVLLPSLVKGRLEMNIRHLRGRITGSLLAFSILFGVALASSATAQAQYPNGRDRYERRRDRDDREREWRRNRNWDRNRDRRNDRYSRNDGYGNNGRYGTHDGYGNNGRYGGYNNNQAELNQGYQYGVNTGASDAQRGQSYNPQRSRYYRNASTQAFREGFVRGYDQGYRQYAGYDNGGYRRGNSRSNVGSILGGIFGRP
jgi:hypothetical protein